MGIEAWMWAVALSALAAWLGYRAGYRHTCTGVGVLLYACGVRSIDGSAGTITFRDGTTRAEPEVKP